VLRCYFERLDRGWNQNDAARASGIPQTTISAIERGRVVPTADEVDALARAYSVTPPSALLREVEAREVEVDDAPMAEHA
jgi:transcriptional regulator with XRE-family HTH domain